MIKNLEQFQTLLTDDGADYVVAGMQQFREAYGENWLEEFKQANPHLVFIVDIVANYEFDAALHAFRDHVINLINNSEESELIKVGQKSLAKGLINANAGELQKLHSKLKSEINKKRF